MRTGLKLCGALVFGLVIAMPRGAARGNEEKVLRPEIQQMKESVCEKIQASADKLGLTPEQREKIKGIQASRAEQHKAMRAERRSLLQEELKALSQVLTPEQREQVKELAEDRRDEVKQERSTGLPAFARDRDTLAERIEAQADKIGLTDAQCTQMTAMLASYADRHAALKAKCRDACEDEFKTISAVLTPDQRTKARLSIEQRVVRAAAAKSIADRIDATADKLALSEAQRQQIARAQTQFAPRYRELRSDRHDLLKEELKSIGAVLTPQQREMVRDFCEDRVEINEMTGTRSLPDAAKYLKETVSDRVEAAADKLELTDAQRKSIAEVRAKFADKFQSQRNQRRDLRKEELKSLEGILTADQREKVKDYVEERSELL
jgi:Spy/CpxP family protein refolding chaperone